MNRTWRVLGSVLACLTAVAGCAPATTDVANAPQTPADPTTPPAVNGWREYPLREGVIHIQSKGWATDTIDILVFGNGGELEYKLGMKKGDAIVYSIDYGQLKTPDLMVSEFHGHTPKGVDGNGDLMFYSKSGGAAQNGSFQAPWDGIHGWYLKNTGDADVTVRLKVAGFYERLDQTAPAGR